MIIPKKYKQIRIQQMNVNTKYRRNMKDESQNGEIGLKHVKHLNNITYKPYKLYVLNHFPMLVGKIP